MFEGEAEAVNQITDNTITNRKKDTEHYRHSLTNATKNLM